VIRPLLDRFSALRGTLVLAADGEDAKMEGKRASNGNRATRVVASTLGVLVGLAGIEHGLFEVLQGDVRPDSIMIEAIGPAQRLWEYAAEPALTIIPSLLVSGILAIIFGILVVLWSVAFIQTRHGPGVLLILSIILWLVGGGFAPIFFTIFAVATATRIDKPLTWWRKALPASARGVLAKIWPWSTFLFVLVFLIGVEIAIFGYPLLWFLEADTTYAIQWNSAYIMLALMLLSIITGFAHDIQKQDELIH
jgi:hypothetical protein